MGPGPPFRADGAVGCGIGARAVSRGPRCSRASTSGSTSTAPTAPWRPRPRTGSRCCRRCSIRPTGRGATRDARCHRRCGRPSTFLRALIKRYGFEGSFWVKYSQLPFMLIRQWQIWNEPNITSYWDASPKSRYGWPRGMSAVARRQQDNRRGRSRRPHRVRRPDGDRLAGHAPRLQARRTPATTSTSPRCRSTRRRWRARWSRSAGFAASSCAPGTGTCACT